jgi:hypothetical protein
MSWLTLGVQERYAGVPNTVAANIIKDVGMVVANPYARYVWRGHGSVDYTLHHSLHRRLGRASVPDTEGMLASAERALIARARAAGYDQFANRTLGDVELVALLQHQGAATRFIDVTPDPFIALFFACEHAESSGSSAALVALLVQDDWLIRPNRVVDDYLNCLDQLDAQRQYEGRPVSSIYYVQTPYLDERMKAQRGQFLVGRRPTAADKRQWSSLDLPVMDRGTERERITRLLAPSRGAPPAGGDRPPLIVFRIRPKVRAALRLQLAERFGYTTETIYPDLNGFALAFSQFAPLE